VRSAAAWETSNNITVATQQVQLAAPNNNDRPSIIVAD
jgi:hypothetical protein